MDGSKGKDCPRSTAVIVTYRRRRRRRKKRRIAKKSATASKSSAHSAQKRISKHLGLVKPSKGGSIPDVKSKSKSSSKSVIPTGSSHYLFGDKNQLMDFNESFHEDVPGPSRRIKPKGEVNSSDEQSDICLVSSSYSQLKSMNNLNNKKYATEDVFKRKIKEEHPSSEDEGGESCSLLTDNLLFIPLTERNDLFNSHQTNSFSCGVAINSSLNEQTNDLPCTQLAKTSCDQKDKSLFTHSTKFPLNAQDDVCKISDELENDLPPTQFAVPASVNYKKEEDVLPSTQPSSPLSSMQMDDLPCTQLVVPALIKEMFKREDALPSTRPSSPVSQMQIANLASTQLMGTLSKKTIFDEEDELPCTQLVRPVSNMEIEDLPCTQLAMPLPNKQIDGLPDTQFIKPALVKYNSKKEDNALPATQPSSSLPQTDDLPCTQLVEAISSKSVFNEEDSIPCTQLARSLSSVDIEDLPCTQLAKPLSNMDMEDLPCTQLTKPLSNMDMEDCHVQDLPCTQLAKPLSNMDMEDLPCTQLAKPLSNMDMEDLPCTQLAKPLSNMDMEDLPSTQLARPSSIIDMEDLPSTQFVVPAPVKYFSKKKDALPTMQPPNSLPQMQTDDLPKTQLVKSLSKTEVSNEEDTLPCTQLARPLSSMDMEDLPCTQLAKPLSDMDMEDLPCTQLAKPLSNMQVDDLPCTQFAVPVPIKYLPKKKDVLSTAQSPNSSQMQTNDVPKTQVVKTSLSDEEDTLPCTQLAPPFSSMDMEDMPSSQLAKPLSGMQMDDLPSTQFVAPASVKRAAKKDEDALPAAQPSSPLYNMEMDDLPCTQLVKSSSVKSLSDKGDDDTLPCTQRSNPVSNLHLYESTNPCLNQNTNVQSKELPTCNANDDDFDLPETQPLISDQQHSKLEKLLENSSDELITDEELLSDIKKLEIKKPIPRKIVGIHKNLPQVLMPIPSRRNPVPKPSNRRTFSFDQVKQQYDTTDEKNALHENISHEAKLVVTKIGDLSTIQTFSSALKEKQQVSSKCKTENPNSLKDEIYSAPNCDFKIKTDKNNVPPDSEIEIINDDETGTKSIEEVVLSSDEEDLPATQFIVRASNQCSRLPNQGKLENVCISVKREHNTSDILPETQKCTGNNKSADVVDISEDSFEKLVVKKEIISGDPEIEIVKTLNSVSVKQEKCEEDILREVKIKPLQQLNGKVLTSVSVKQENCEEDTLREVKIEPLQQLKTEEQVGRLIKSKNESLDLEDSTNVRNIQYADKCKNQKMSNGKDIYNDSINKCALGLEKHVREHKIIINDHNRKKAKGHSNSSEDKLKIENGKKNKPERNPEIGTHSDVENKVETKTSSRSLSKTNGNSKIKVNTENVNQLKLINKDKKSKTEHISPSQTHAKIEPIKNHKLVTEKSKSSSKEKNYYEDSKKRKLSNLDNSEKVQNHKKLKGDSLTIKKEPLSDKNGKSSLKKNFDVKKDAHELKNNIKMEDSRRESSEKTIKTDKISNSGKVKEAVVGYDSKNRKDDKYAKIHNKKFESKSSNKSSSEMNLKIKESDAHDKKGNIKHVNSDNKCKGYGNIPFSEKERPNGKIKAESDSIQKVKNQLKDSKTNFKDESAKTNLVLKRSASNEGERNTKRPHRESLSCSEDTSDCHSDYSRSSVISSESNFRKKYKHQRNALNVLNEVADEIISSSKDCKTDILNQNEDVTFEVMKRNKNPSAVGRKVDKAHLKDEIAAEVKIALKPFYSVGLIDKDDYKDIMRKAVPKIYLNCGNYVIPEKIRNLVSSYVKKLTNS
ncbi:PHD and RING finger domain-containing protein 1 [Argiope bruennichi]|uniref:PHD and RING finger domain-containing protein 1 n=1 Tax=Argiope bruennichi TaxID=94029 RepID=A0A8T0EQN7_ARGBR|nr:PHD and RING finger domain-containing protein 1 [Argiope bruennichi]